MTTKDSEQVAKNEQVIARDRDKRGDAKFKQAMLRARREGTETVFIGVVKKPCTERAAVLARPETQMLRSNSTSAQCAEIGGKGGSFT